MTKGLVAFANRDRYRPVSLALQTVTLLPLAGIFVNILGWLFLLPGVLAAIVLTIMTYHRLRDGGLPGTWAILIIMPLSIGPTWRLSEHLTFSLGSDILSCVPVILAWIIPAKGGKQHGPEAI